MIRALKERRAGPACEMEESRMKRRFTAMLLALALVCSLLPGTAWAAGPAPTEIEYEVTGGKIIIDSTTGYVVKCTGSPTEISIPEEIETGGAILKIAGIKENAFGGRKFDGLKSIIIPGGLDIEGNAFAQCTGLESVMILGSGVDTIKTGTFANCSIKSFVGKVGTIESNAFSGCANLVSVIIPLGTGNTVIKNAAFTQCNALKNVYIAGTYGKGSFPDGVAFIGCPVLETIHVGGKIDKYGLEELFGKATPVKSHTAANAYIDQLDSSCIEAGHITAICSCSELDCTFNKPDTLGIPNITLPLLDHKIDYTIKPTPATCDTEGDSGSGKCTRDGCTYTIGPNEKIPALGHLWVKTETNPDGTPMENKGVVVKEATCQEEGLVWFTSVCTRDSTHTVEATTATDFENYKEGEEGVTAVLPKVGHDFVFPSPVSDADWELEVKKATCVLPGVDMVKKTCRWCKEAGLSEEQKQEIATSYQDYIYAEEQISKLGNDQWILETQIQELQNKIGDINFDIQNVQNELDLNNSDLLNVNVDLKTNKEALDEVEKNLSENTKQLDEAEARIKEIEAELEALTRQLLALQAARDAGSGKTKEELEKEKAELEAKRAALEQEKEQWTAEKERLTAERENYTERLNELSEAREEKEKAKAGFEAEQKKLTEQKTELERQKEELLKQKDEELPKKIVAALNVLAKYGYAVMDNSNPDKPVPERPDENYIRGSILLGHDWVMKLSPEQEADFNCESSTVGNVILSCTRGDYEKTIKGIHLKWDDVDEAEIQLKAPDLHDLYRTNMLAVKALWDSLKTHIAIPDAQLTDGQRERLAVEKEAHPEDYKEATCAEGGQDGHAPFICSICDTIFWDDIPAPEHKPGQPEEVIIKPATCLEPGIKKTGVIKCTVCGEILDESNAKEEAIPKGEHEAVPGSEKSTVTKQPTCTEPGEEVTTAECVHCHQEFKSIKVLPATGHQIGGNVTETVTKEPTCTEEGLKTVTGMGTCTVCGETVDAGSNGATFTIPALGHSFGAWKENADGSKERTCSRCGLKEKVDKDGNLVDPDAPDEPKPPVVDPDKTYSISLGRIYRGTVVRSATTAKAGTAITLTAYANAGYEVSEVYVQDAGGNRVAVSAGEETTYTFTMPASNVTVYASFADAYSSNPPSTGAATPSVRPDASKPSKWNGVPVNQDAPNAAASWTGFYDVPSTHWASGEILWAYQNGYMTANSSGGFNPNGAFTGGQLWVALARLMGQRPANVQEAQQWAMRNGFADGIGPNTKVTRQQLVVALYRCAGLLGRPTNTHGSLSGYIDSATVPVAARNAMSWALMHGIIGGTADKRLNPKGATTRAQFAVFLYRFSQQIL